MKLNAATTADAYTPANTVTFAAPRPMFSMNILNATIYYQLYYVPAGQDHTRDLEPDPTGEHQLPPSFNRFNDTHGEGLPPGSMFGGVRVRSAVPGTPAVVTVI